MFQLIEINDRSSIVRLENCTGTETHPNPHPYPQEIHPITVDAEVRPHLMNVYH